MAKADFNPNAFLQEIHLSPKFIVVAEDVGLIGPALRNKKFAEGFIEKSGGIVC